MSWIDDLATYLAGQLDGYTVGTNIFKRFMPDTPDASICIYDAGGNSEPFGSAVPYQEIPFEIRVRSTSASASRTILDLVLAKLDYKQTLTLGSLVVFAVHKQGEPGILERDQQNRITWLARFTMQARRSSNYI